VKCLLLNAHSLINKFNIFEAVVNALDADIIGVTRSVTTSWAIPQMLDSKISLCGYQLVHSDRSSPNKGGGVLLYVRNSLKPTEFSVDIYCNDNVWCQIDDLLIGVCYRSTNYATVGNDNNNKLYKLFNKVSTKHVLLMRDFNFSVIDWFSSGWQKYEIPRYQLNWSPKCSISIWSLYL